MPYTSQVITVGGEEDPEVREKDYEITLGGEANPDQFMGEVGHIFCHLWSVVE